MKHSGTFKESGAISAYTRLAEVMNIIEGVPHGIAITDTEFRLVTMNTYMEALCGYPVAIARGVDADLILKTNVMGRERDWRTVMSGEAPSTIEGDIITAQRKKLPVRFTFKTLSAEEQTLAGMLIFIEDISAIKEMQAKSMKGQACGEIIGKSPKMLEVLDSIPVFANTNATLLITGETGTGKDLLAETIHKSSRRSSYPFIKVNCGALPETLLESELFGHVKGAFTGAHSDKPGMFRLAEGGTIYLTEIGDLPLPLQVKLLTVLDDREFYPVGASRKVSVDVRLVAGTHHDLKKSVREGRFREDLYFRLNVLRAHMPPLRERTGDVQILLNHFMDKVLSNLKKPVTGFSKKVMEKLERYRYPGNVRELCNIVEYSATMCREGKILPEHLPQYISSPQALPESAAVTTVGMESSWTSIEKKRILEALLHARGNRGKAAEALGWARSTLWRKIHQYGIE